ncbi:MAG: ABC transporter substrate-binding protein [Spirochaetaceae bacterium]|nr:MAG: ABC transporter substrate-binding protein [Spirochaetaceae bacterium]
MRRFISIALVLVLVGATVAVAGGRKESADSNVIGISKIVSHPALDAVEQGIQDELAEMGYSFQYDLQNANGDAGTAAQIAAKFRSDRVRVAVGIATPTSQALVQSISDLPVIYTAVTDPVSAGLVESYDQGGANVTGFSDMTPVAEQIELLVELGNVRRLGHVYASGEANAVVLANMARDAARRLGIEFVEATVTSSAEVRQAAQSIVGRVDAIYVSTDNTVVSALTSLTEVANRAGVPIVSADPSSAEEFDVLAAYGFDYYTMGRATGRLISRIVEGESTASIPTQYMTDASDLLLLLNLDVAAQLGLQIPQAVIDQADMIVQNGTVTRK